MTLLDSFIANFLPYQIVSFPTSFSILIRLDKCTVKKCELFSLSVMHLNVSQFEKAKFYERHPWLLPKSYENCNSVPPLPFSSLKKLFCANCQVNDVYFFLYVWYLHYFDKVRVYV